MWTLAILIGKVYVFGAVIVGLIAAEMFTELDVDGSGWRREAECIKCGMAVGLAWPIAAGNLLAGLWTDIRCLFR